MEKLAAMLFPAGSTLFLPFKSGAKVGPIPFLLLIGQRRLSSPPMAAGEILQHTRPFNKMDILKTRTQSVL